MNRYLNILFLFAASLAAMTACSDSPLEDWEPYLPTGSSVPVSSSISVDKTAISVGAAASSESVVITTTDTWAATASDAWITLSAASGSSGQTVTISIAENTTASQRTGKVTFSNAGGKSAIVNVTQEGKTLSVNPTSLNFQAEGGTSTIDITTNGNYTWNKSEIGAWLTIAQSDKGLNVTATKNQKPEQRVDTLTIYVTGLTEGSVSRDVIITQYGTEYTFDIDKTSITASSAECSDAIQLSTNDAWTASASDKWITLSSTSGTGSLLININLAENKTPNERKGTVTFVGTNSKISKTVDITQSGKTLSVSPESLSFDTGGGTKTVTVTTDGTFATSKDADWITVSTSGNTISVKVSANTSTSSRTGKVTVSLTGLSEGSLSKTVNVQQDAQDDVTFEDYGDLKPLD